MSAFLHRVNLYAEPGEPTFLEVVVNWDNGLTPNGIDITHRRKLTDSPNVFMVLANGIDKAIKAIEEQYDFVVDGDLTGDEMDMLERQYEKRNK